GEMSALHCPVLDCTGRLVVEKRSPAYLLSNKEGRLLEWGGDLALYGIENLQVSQSVGKQIFFLDGILPLDGSPLFLSRIKTDSDLSVDLHIFSTDAGDWVLLLDATSEELQHREIQQKINDLSLLRDRQSRMLEQSLGG